MVAGNVERLDSECRVGDHALQGWRSRSGPDQTGRCPEGICPCLGSAGQVPYEEKTVRNIQWCRWHANAWPYFYSVAIRFDFSSDFEGVLIIGGVKVHD